MSARTSTGLRQTARLARLPVTLAGFARAALLAGTFLLCSCTDPAERLEAEGLALDPQAFLAAAERGDAGTVARYLDAGMPVEAIDEAGNTALVLAVVAEREPVVRALLDAGADPDHRTPSGATPLLLAVTRGAEAIVDDLLAGGADTEVREHDFGLTPLALAAYRGFDGIAEALIQAGADVAARDDAGRTALDHARREQHAAVVALLERRAAPGRVEPATVLTARDGPWLPLGWSLHDPFDDASPYWPELGVFRRRLDPPASLRALLRSPPETYTQIFLVVGPRAPWEAHVLERVSDIAGDPLLSANAHADFTTLDGRAVHAERFDLGAGALGGEPVSLAIATVSLGERQLTAAAGTGADVDLLDALAQVLGALDVSRDLAASRGSP